MKTQKENAFSPLTVEIAREHGIKPEEVKNLRLLKGMGTFSAFYDTGAQYDFVLTTRGMLKKNSIRIAR